MSERIKNKERNEEKQEQESNTKVTVCNLMLFTGKYDDSDIGICQCWRDI